MPFSTEFTANVEAVAWLIGKAVAILTGALVIWQKFLRPYLVVKVFYPLKQHFNNIATLSEMAGDLKMLMPKMSQVVKAVLPNNGSSMPDSLNRLEVAVTSLQAQSDDSVTITEAMLWNHPKAMFRCDNKGSNNFVNLAYGRLLRCDVDSLNSLGWRSYILPDDLLKYDEIWQKAFQEQRSCWFHIRMVDTERNIIPVSVQFTALLNHRGNFCGFLGMVDLHNEH